MGERCRCGYTGVETGLEALPHYAHVNQEIGAEIVGEKKFTPGPWHWNVGETYIELLTLGNRVCVLGASANPDDIDPPSEADAHLIAAAPELYEALLAMRGTRDHAETSDYPDKCPACQAQIAADAALAKARGEK